MINFSSSRIDLVRVCGKRVWKFRLDTAKASSIEITSTCRGIHLISKRIIRLLLYEVRVTCLLRNAEFPLNRLIKTKKRFERWVGTICGELARNNAGCDRFRDTGIPIVCHVYLPQGDLIEYSDGNYDFYKMLNGSSLMNFLAGRV